MSSASETSVPVERYTGRVKWFNNKTGYGFVTVLPPVTLSRRGAAEPRSPGSHPSNLA